MAYSLSSMVLRWSYLRSIEPDVFFCMIFVDLDQMVARIRVVVLVGRLGAAYRALSLSRFDCGRWFTVHHSQEIDRCFSLELIHDVDTGQSHPACVLRTHHIHKRLFLAHGLVRCWVHR